MLGVGGHPPCVTWVGVRRRGWWPNVRGWERVDGWRIDTPDPGAMAAGPWFGLAFSPGAADPVHDLIRGLDAGAAMDRIDAVYPPKTPAKHSPASESPPPGRAPAR